jgi:hypothetical protein
MRYSTHKHRIGIVELTYFLIGVVLLLLLASIARGQVGRPLYREYRGVRLGMTATEARAKLGEPVMKSNEQDYYVFSATETAQLVYDGSQKVITISTDYMGGVGAPDYKAVVGENLLQRPDGSLFRMVLYDSERLWVSYNSSAATVPLVTITIGAYK